MADGTRCREICGWRLIIGIREVFWIAAAEGHHLAMKSGMLAAETIFRALKAGTVVENAERLSKKSRELHQEELGGAGFFINRSGMECFADFSHCLQQVTGGRG